MSVSENQNQVFYAFALPVTLVTVFNDRAEVKRTVKTSLNPGINKIIVEEITKFAVEGSLRVDQRGDAIIYEVNIQKNVSLLDETEDPRLGSMREEKKTLTAEQQRLEDRKEVLERQIQTLGYMALQVSDYLVKIPDDGRSLLDFREDELKSMTDFLDFFVNLSMEKRNILRRCVEDLKDVEKDLLKLETNIHEAQRFLLFNRKIVILVERGKSSTVEFDISYQVCHAKWCPSYDIRVSNSEDDQGLMEVIYYGKVEQLTGEHWIYTPIRLSTARPILEGTVPKVGTLNATLCVSEVRPCSNVVKKDISEKIEFKSVYF